MPDHTKLLCIPTVQKHCRVLYGLVHERLLHGRSELTSACSSTCNASRPVRAGIPVHINGYFELSSNRRNIWHSSLQSESSGAGKHKSDWNIALLEVRDILLMMHWDCRRHCLVSHRPQIVRQQHCSRFSNVES